MDEQEQQAGMARLVPLEEMAHLEQLVQQENRVQMAEQVQLVHQGELVPLERGVLMAEQEQLVPVEFKDELEPLAFRVVMGTLVCTYF